MAATDLIPDTSAFKKVSILIAAINETVSLSKTVEILNSTCSPDDIAEILLLVSPRSTPECLAVCKNLEAQKSPPIQIVVQKRPFAGGAYQDGFDLAQGSHVLMMASDLETDPNDVSKMIDESKKYPSAVICTSRWIQGSNFGSGYNPVKYVANYIFQKLIAILFLTSLTDLTFGFRLFPAAVVKSIRWQEMRHPFFLETIIKPLRLGVPTREIPTSWVARSEGESQNSFWRNFLYFKIAWRTRFTSRGLLVKTVE